MKDKLIRKLNSGSVKAFEQIVHKYGGYVYAVVRNHSGGLLSAEDIEELVSDTFAALWRKRETLDSSRPVMPYLAVTARNLTINRLRQVKLTVSLEDAELSDVSFEDRIENAAVIGSILEAAEALGDKQREIFTRFYLYGEKVSDISEKMNISLSDAKSSLFRARQNIKKSLDERGYFDE